MKTKEEAEEGKTERAKEAEALKKLQDTIKKCNESDFMEVLPFF